MSSEQKDMQHLWVQTTETRSRLQNRGAGSTGFPRAQNTLVPLSVNYSVMGMMVGGLTSFWRPCRRGEHNKFLAISEASVNWILASPGIVPNFVCSNSEIIIFTIFPLQMKKQTKRVDVPSVPPARKWPLAIIPSQAIGLLSLYSRYSCHLDFWGLHHWDSSPTHNMFLGIAVLN